VNVAILNPGTTGDGVYDYLEAKGFTVIWSTDPPQERILMAPDRRERIATAALAGSLSRSSVPTAAAALAALHAADELIKLLDAGAA
jgi:hypothetical protein